MFDKIFRKDELKILWPFYTAYFIIGISMMIFPFMIIYFQQLGFSFLQIAIITGALSFGVFIFEIPTGAFADAFSRKFSTILGMMLRGITGILFFIVNDFYALVIISLLAGFSMSLVSGAAESWAVSNLRKLKRKELVHEMFIKSQSIMAFGVVFAPLLGAFLVKSHPIKLLWLIFGVGIMIAAIIMSFAPELDKPKRKYISIINNTFSTALEGIKFVKKNRNIYLIIIGTILLSMMGLGDLGWQPLMTDLGLPDYALGFVFSIMAAVLIITPLLSRYFIKFRINKFFPVISIIRMIILMLLFLVFPPMYMIAALYFILEHGIYSLSDPVLSAYIHKKIPEKIRATIISLRSMAVEISYVIVSITAGALMDIYGPKNVVAISGLLGILAFIVFSKIND